MTGSGRAESGKWKSGIVGKAAAATLPAAVVLAVALLAAGCGREQAPAARSAQAPGQASESAPEAVGAAVEQKICPVMNGPIDKAYFADHNGRRIYFCCEACIATFKSDPARYIAIVDAALSRAERRGDDARERAAEQESQVLTGHEGHNH